MEPNNAWSEPEMELQIAMQANPLTMAQNDLRYSSNAALARSPPPLVIHASTQNKWLPIQMHAMKRQGGKQRTSTWNGATRMATYLEGSWPAIIGTQRQM